MSFGPVVKLSSQGYSNEGSQYMFSSKKKKKKKKEKEKSQNNPKYNEYRFSSGALHFLISWTEKLTKISPIETLSHAVRDSAYL